MSAIIRQRSGVILISLRSQLGRTTSGPTGEEIPSTGATGDAALPLGKAVQPNNGIAPGYQPNLHSLWAAKTTEGTHV